MQVNSRPFMTNIYVVEGKNFKNLNIWRTKRAFFIEIKIIFMNFEGLPFHTNKIAGTNQLQIAIFYSAFSIDVTLKSATLYFMFT